MAAMSFEATPPAGDDADRSATRAMMPSRNPLPLSASQEAQVREVFYARVRRHCSAEIKGTTPSFSWPLPMRATAAREGRKKGPC